MSRFQRLWLAILVLGGLASVWTDPTWSGLAGTCCGWAVPVGLPLWVERRRARREQIEEATRRLLGEPDPFEQMRQALERTAKGMQNMGRAARTSSSAVAQLRSACDAVATAVRRNT